MEILKLAVTYFISVSGKTIDDFYDNLMTACADDLNKQTGFLWLIHALVIRVEEQGFSLQDILSSKEILCNQLDNSKVEKYQNFSVNKVWGKETCLFIKENISNLDNFVLWNLNYSNDNLINQLGLNAENIFKNTIDNLDFIGDSIDNIVLGLPEKLKTTILNNEKLLVLLCIPQYKENTNCYVTDEMYDNNLAFISENIYFQYLWQLLNLKKRYNLTNLYIGFFGDTYLYTNNEYQTFLSMFMNCFMFENGYCFSLKDFEVTLNNINGLHFSLWSTNEVKKKPVLLYKKRLVTKTKIETGELILYDIDRGSLIDWLQPKDILFYENVPTMLNYGTFLNANLFDRNAIAETKSAENSLGTLTISDSMKDLEKVLLLSSMPVQLKGKSNRVKVVTVTKENFWRCVASFAFVRLVNRNWNNEKMNISVPNENVENYDIWVKNALPMFLFDEKATFSAIRNVNWNGIIYNLQNKMFFMDKKSISLFCEDTRLLAQLNDLDNDFIVEQIKEAKQVWSIETKQLFDFCFDFVQRTFDLRAKEKYSFGTDALDAGFTQISKAFSNDTVYVNNFTKLYMVYKENLYKQISKFGFLREV